MRIFIDASFPSVMNNPRMCITDNFWKWSIYAWWTANLLLYFYFYWNINVFTNLNEYAFIVWMIDDASLFGCTLCLSSIHSSLLWNHVCPLLPALCPQVYLAVSSSCRRTHTFPQNRLTKGFIRNKQMWVRLKNQ